MASCCDEPRLLPLDAALARMQAEVAPITAVETVALQAALDRVLAQPVQSPVDVPAHPNSAMDGYAVRAEDAVVGASLRLAGTALAGHPFTGQVEPGTCVRITTGATMAAGADAVVMQENVDVDVEGERVVVREAVRAGENVRRRGEDIETGIEIVSAGTRLGPVDVGLLASVGVHQVPVFRRLRIAVLSTGDELAPPGQPLPEGHIYDSNRYGIMAMLQRLGADVIDLGLVPDQPDAISKAFMQAAQQADAVISSGGVSVGDADYVKDILAGLGTINFWKVAIKPGKPFAFGQLGAGWFFGLPGNPVSAMVTLHQLALPVLRYMAGEAVSAAPIVKAQASTRFKKRPGRMDFQRATLFADGDETQVRPNGAQGSGILTSFRDANCYALLEQERGHVEEGEIVTVLPFDRFIV
jgi:molybdopterin molybdotransferase